MGNDESSKTYSHRGDIYVGGNVEIKRNFFASGSNTFHLTSENSKHTINMWDKWFSDQYFNNFYVDNQGLDALDIKEVFDCKGTFVVKDWGALRQSIAGCITLDQNYLTNLRDANETVRAKTNAGILRLLYDEEKTTLLGDFKFTGKTCEKEFAYLENDGTVSYYTVKVSYFGTTVYTSGVRYGTAEYTGPEGRYGWFILSPESEMNGLLKGFGVAAKKYIIQAVGDEVKSMYKNALKSCLLELLPSDLGNAYEVTKVLKKSKKIFDGYYKLIK